MLRQALLASLGEIVVITGSVTFDQITHLGRLRLPEGVDRFGGIEPSEEDVADRVRASFDSHLVRTEIARTQAVDRDDLVGQQAEIVLCIGITDTKAQASFILGADMRYAKTGTTDFGASLGR